MSQSVVDYRIAIGQWVKNRLLGNPAAMKIPSANLDIFVVRDFLTAEECAGMVALIDAARIPSKLLSPSADPEFRTSESCNLDPLHPLVGQVEGKITTLMGIYPENGETIQGQRYAIGQRFKAHHDFFHMDQPYWPAMEASGGQRTWTAMAFLNTPEGGGQTAFEQAGLKIAPRAGNLLVWNNLDGDGAPNVYSMHEGCPVTAGTKYIITKWYRERTWTHASVATY